jgi:hypothetical protein
VALSRPAGSTPLADDRSGHGLAFNDDGREFLVVS